MFSSPAHMFTSETADNSVQRKPGLNVPIRKPFFDKSVNSNTSDIKLIKSKLNLSPEIDTFNKLKLSEESLDAEEFMFSFKDVEDMYEDVYKGSRLRKEHVIKILRNYCNSEDTPPPSPEPTEFEVYPIFFELPDLQRPKFDDKKFEVELPDFPNFDISI